MNDAEQSMRFADAMYGMARGMGAGENVGATVAFVHFILIFVKRHPEWAMAWEAVLSREVVGGGDLGMVADEVVRRVGSPAGEDDLTN